MTTSNKAADAIHIRRILEEAAEPEFCEFTSKLLPGTQGILGVRLPYLRKLAKQQVKGEWKGILKEYGICQTEQGSEMSPLGFEEILFYGFLIGYGYDGENFEEFLDAVNSYVPLIDNWSVCDSFCATLKQVRGHRQEVFEFLQPFLQSEKEFEVRFGLVMLLNHYMEPEWMPEIHRILDAFTHPAYYAQMAAAWLLSICYIKMPEATMEYLRCSKLDTFTYHKALQKIRESLAVSREAKEQIKLLRRD